MWPSPVRLPTIGLTIAICTIAIGKADEWQTDCGRSAGELTICRHIKGDAMLQGAPGILNTIIFPDGDTRQYFYTGGSVGDLEGLKVRNANSSSNGWWDAYGYTRITGERHRLYFQLPSGNIFMWINAYVD